MTLLVLLLGFVVGYYAGLVRQGLRFAQALARLSPDTLARLNREL